MLVAVAGPPGSGKTTFAAALVAAVSRRTTRTAALVAQDGFHLDNAVLASSGLLARKGAPETFDVEGLSQLLEELRTAGGDVGVPVFDRGRDAVRENAAVVPGAADTIIVEGNYLLLDAPPWRRLRPLFDMTIMLTCATETLRTRLTERWLRHGLSPDAAAARAEGNDLRNARLVVERSADADLVIANA
ncbi:MAG: AAA family ATPase [Caulobacteraceae bacterium]|nr:AAA family ATPase [Caulobacter sp.]